MERESSSGLSGIWLGTEDLGFQFYIEEKQLIGFRHIGLEAHMRDNKY